MFPSALWPIHLEVAMRARTHTYTQRHTSEHTDNGSDTFRGAHLSPGRPCNQKLSPAQRPSLYDRRHQAAAARQGRQCQFNVGNTLTNNCEQGEPNLH